MFVKSVDLDRFFINNKLSKKTLAFYPKMIKKTSSHSLEQLFFLPKVCFLLGYNIVYL